jgi:ABC-type lipoprotein export system ATPase subunit
LHEVWKVYRTGDGVVRALKAISAEILAGEFACLRGASGSGKSTLLGILGGLEPPTDGEVVVLGRRYQDMAPQESGRFRRTNIGFMFQELTLVPHLTAVENVYLPRLFDGVSRRELDTQAKTLLDRVGLAHRAAHQPRQLSVGERQRVALARAIVNRPPLLLVDEPTANLDGASAERVLGLLQELRKEGTTVVVATHDDRVERAATRVLRLNDGMLQPGGADGDSQSST